jgi:hypothetical protein
MTSIVQVDKNRLLDKLYLTGHFWGNPELRDVKQADLSKLDLDHKLVKQAVASWQNLDANFDVLALIHHLRHIIADGDVGPVTASMLDVPRCPMPDYAPPPGASFDYGHEGLNEAVKSYQMFAEYKGGSGSWPKCDPQRPDVHSTRVNLTTANASTHQKGILKESVALVEKCEAEMGQAVRHIMDGDAKEAEHDVRFEYIAGGVIGYAYFPTPDTCDQVVQCRIDNSYNPSAITFANLLVHEYKGHSDGLEHTNGGIMNPSIITFNPLTWKGDKHESTKRRFFGGVAVPPVNPPDPPVPSPPTDHNGMFLYQGKLLKIKVFE